jgi:rubredoxin
VTAPVYFDIGTKFTCGQCGHIIEVTEGADMSELECLTLMSTTPMLFPCPQCGTVTNQVTVELPKEEADRGFIVMPAAMYGNPQPVKWRDLQSNVTKED